MLILRLYRSLRSQVAGAVIATGILSLFSYAALYVAYFQFYVPLGLRPADVGLTKLRLLEESLIALLILPFTRLIMHWPVAIAVLSLAGIAVLWFGRRRGWPRAHVVRRLVDTQVSTFAAILVALGLYGYLCLVYDARRLGDSVSGDGLLVVAWVTHTQGLNLPNIDVQAIPATVVRQTDPPLELTAGCTLYLGQSVTHAVLFDVRREKVVRVPLLGTVVVTHPARLRYGERLPKICTSNEGNETTSPPTRPLEAEPSR